MFSAKFKQTSGLPFKADKNGNFPYIGTVVSGTAKGTLINGTMFQREGLEANKLYLCDNTVDPAYPANQQVQIITELSSIRSIMEARTDLGAPRDLSSTSAAVSAEEEIPTV
jgi:hypothetical protein